MKRIKSALAGSADYSVMNPTTQRPETRAQRDERENRERDQRVNEARNKGKSDEKNTGKTEDQHRQRGQQNPQGQERREETPASG